MSDFGAMANEFLEIIESTTTHAKRLSLTGKRMAALADEMKSQVDQLDESGNDFAMRIVSLLDEMSEAVMVLSDDYIGITDFAARMYILAHVRSKGHDD